MLYRKALTILTYSMEKNLSCGSTCYADQKSFIFPNGHFVLFMEQTMTSNNTDYDVQINHAGYAAAGSPIAHIPLDKIEYHRLVLNQSIKLFSYLIPVISSVLYETNKFPNFIHTDRIISEINVPFLTCVLEHMTGMGDNKKELIELGQSA